MQNKTKYFLIFLLLLIAFCGGVFIAEKYNFKYPFYEKKVTLPQEKLKIEEKPAKIVIIGENSIVEAAEIAKSSVVNIDITQYRKVNLFGDFFENEPLFKKFFGDVFPLEKLPQYYKMEGKGSGVIIDRDGYILTNEHVIRNANEIKVTLLDGREFKGKVVGSDRMTDIAVVKIPAHNLPVAKLGDSDRVRVGEWVIAIGNPFGYSHTVTCGIISAKGRSLKDVEEGKILEGLLQTDAAINRGNSGGPLVNLRGEVIGINTAIFPSEEGGFLGIGFAIPINKAKEIMTQLIKEGKVRRPWVGIGLQDLTPEIAKKFAGRSDLKGAIINQVYPGSPAEKSGLKVGDIILEIDRKKIKSAQDVVNEVRKHKVGEVIVFLILREKHTSFISVKLAEMK